MTQLEKARQGKITQEMESVAKAEGIHPEVLGQRVAGGLAVIPANPNHRGLVPCGIGLGLRTKVNANIGTSPVFPDWQAEVEKLEAALAAGADTVMDLSTGGDVKICLREILSRSHVPVGTVPVYEAAVRTREKSRPVVEMEPEELFAVIEDQAIAGVDFMTVHCGVTRRIVEGLKQRPRLAGIVSRGGAIMAGWMLHRGEENPLYAQFDRLLEICREHDVTLSLGDGLRPGCLADATDWAQLQELMVLGELVLKAREAGVQVMVEGPGHVPLNQVQANIQLQKRLCHGAPFYVLGPIVTDIAAGYDHIAAAIGGALAAWAGADFLCYVTPTEHLGLPTGEDVREGVVASRIAAHAADIAKGLQAAWARDEAMGRARRELDWGKQFELALDPEKARQIRRERNPFDQEVCSMCGEYCAIDLVNKYL
ncbi:MAG: phosphomethylpyrimidine synthase ThiC [Syntrophothermus sp.]|uniref:phosphomethylpyrimidine synthase ThiC n=1 Tax=Syntrophothermus sp. TaxID=2736299 RepID=UPI00257C58F5|nr:phosphomethylpyrimidine synthase ThiC [Syntrophothermus sp.]NSW81689.1 phosphomethylpyrimidine synthase ThiC [Syntrophothermus sp.]